MIIYDIEIQRAIPPRDDTLRVKGREYCEGWGDHAGMGVACICAFDLQEKRYRVFTEGNFGEFMSLIRGRTVAGFNSRRFDDAVCAAAGIPVTTTYDLLIETWAADGLGPDFDRTTHGGYGLDALALANGITGKTGHGADAPIWWQRGQYGRVIDYCLEDVRITAQLIGKVIAQGQLTSPKLPARHLTVAPPLFRQYTTEDEP